MSPSAVTIRKVLLNPAGLSLPSLRFTSKSSNSTPIGRGTVFHPYAIMVSLGKVGTVTCQPAGTHCSSVSPFCSTRIRTPSGNSAAPADVDVVSDFAGLKSIHCSAWGIALSITSCQSAQPVVSGLLMSILPDDFPLLREKSSYEIALSFATKRVDDSAPRHQRPALSAGRQLSAARLRRADFSFPLWLRERPCREWSRARLGCSADR